METTGKTPKGLVARSTLHRALKARGLSARKLKPPEDKDLDRFQADYANDLWQADMLAGPWLPDPARPGKNRRTYMYAFLDDASRLVPYGRFFFKGDLPALELVMKRSIQRFGRPVRVFYDNGMVFRSKKMAQICASLGMHRTIFTTPYRPEGHGKIEAFNRLCRAQFIAELKASPIRTLEDLNRAFLAWLELDYQPSLPRRGVLPGPETNQPASVGKSGRLRSPGQRAAGAIYGMGVRHDGPIPIHREPGAPIDNNICERALKKAILHRKNAYFYKTENGARVGDLYMSFIHTCELNGVNPFDFLTELQKHAAEIPSSPERWLPWNFRDALDGSASPNQS